MVSKTALSIPVNRLGPAISDIAHIESEKQILGNFDLVKMGIELTMQAPTS